MKDHRGRSWLVGFFLLLPSVLVSATSGHADEPSTEQDTLNRALRFEARLGRWDRIEALLKRGADLNSAAPYGETALYYAIQFGQLKTALRLIERGANPNTGDELDRSPLLKAAEDCNWRVVQALLKKGAEINRTDIFGKTPLINAAESGCVKATAVLLTLGRGKIKIDARDGNYRTAAEYARHPWIQDMIALAAGRATETGTIVNPRVETLR